MASHYHDPKKRPPPISIPPPAVPRLSHVPAAIPYLDFPSTSRRDHAQQRQQQQQGHARVASRSALQEPRSTGSTPLVSPPGPDVPALTKSDSSRSRTPAKKMLTNLVDPARKTPRKSEQDSIGVGGRDSTPRHPGRSQQTVTAATQAQLDFNKLSVRGRVEARAEQRAAEKRGLTQANDNNTVQIETVDLREQCRAMNAEKQKKDREDSVKSPKKKLFGSIRNPFKSSTTVPPPPDMPSKAAQVLGTSKRIPHIIEVRPIKPAHLFETPAKVTHLERSTSLPAKVPIPPRYLPGLGLEPPKDRKQSSEAERVPSMPHVKLSLEPALPPTPPKKDTPPTHRQTLPLASPLRRTAPSEDLRENYEPRADNRTGVRLPNFALSPLSSMSVLPEDGGASPTKFRPYTADEYTKLIGGEAMQRPYPESNEWSHGREADRRKSPAGVDALQFHLPYRRSSDTRLPPRFYSPSTRSFQAFAEGETPSKNSDASRLLFTVAPNRDLVHLREDSNSGSIEMVYQGDATDIDKGSSTEALLSGNMQIKNPRPTHDDDDDDDDVTPRGMQELQLGEQQEPSRPNYGTSRHLQPEQSLSRLSDILKSVSPLMNSGKFEFAPTCPSAVPSPLHKLPGAMNPVRLPDRWAPQNTPKFLDDHFYMTNEHLDVVGKTTWDLLESFKKQQLVSQDDKHVQMMALIEKHATKHAKDIKSLANTVNENSNRAAEKHANLQNDLVKLFNIIETEVAGALATQDKKTAQLESRIGELQTTVQMLKKMLEQKATETETEAGEHESGSFPVPTPDSIQPHNALPALRSQPSLTGYHTDAGKAGREGQMHNSRTMSSPSDSPMDAGASYNTGYGHHRGGRMGHAVRNNQEDGSTYVSTNPYHFVNGGPFQSGYVRGYSAYKIAPSPSEQHYGFQQGSAK